MKNKTYRFAAVAAVLLAFCLVFMMPVGATNVASVTNSDGTTTTEYATLQAALSALKDGGTLTLLESVTISEKWDCRIYKNTAPITIEGNDKSIIFTGSIDDGYNNLAAFRFEADATVKNLTIDMSGAVSVFQNRFSAISTTANLIIENCSFIGSTTYTNGRAIIYGEHGSNPVDPIRNVGVSITGSNFRNWKYGVVDNMNGDVDIKSLTIDNNEFENAGVQVSAYDEIVFTNNDMIGSGVSITSYTAPINKVTATDNTLDASETNKISSSKGIASLESDESFALGLNVKVGDAYYGDIQEAIKAAAPSGTVEILGDITVKKWKMFSETLSIGNGNIITLTIDGLTINGNGHTLTVNSIESAGNGNSLFYDATNLNINDLNIKYADGVSGEGIGLKAGTISGVTIEGDVYGIRPQTGAVIIEDCTFNTGKTSIYFEKERDGLTVTGCTFENPDTVNAILIRGDVTFTDNTIVSGRTVNVVSGSPTVTGNDFGEVRFKVYNDATATITDNVINNLVFDNEEAVKSAFGDNTLSDEAQAALNSVDYVVLPSTQPATPSSSSGGHSEPGAYYNYPRTVSDGGLVEFGTSKVVKSVTLPAGSNGAVVLHIDSTAYWPLATDSEFTFDISVENLGVGTSYISFKIDESKLSALDITAADVGVYHNVNGEWVKLTVTYKIEEGDVIYTAETDSFSPFKLVVEAGAAKPAETQDEPVTPPTEEPSDEPQDVPGEILPEIPGVQDEPEEPSSPAPLLGVLAALGAAVVLRRK